MANQFGPEVLIVSGDSKLLDRLAVDVAGIYPLATLRYASSVAVAQIILQGPDAIDLVMVEMRPATIDLIPWMRLRSTDKLTTVIAIGESEPGARVGAALMEVAGFLEVSYDIDSLRRTLQQVLSTT